MEFLLQLVCPLSETEEIHTIGQLRGLLPTWLQSGAPRRHTDERLVLHGNGCRSLEGGHPSKSKVLLLLLIYSTGQGKSLCIAQLQGQEVSLKATESLCPGTAFSWPPTRLARVPELCSEQALLFPKRHPQTSVPAPRPLSILWEDGLCSDPKPVLDHFSLFQAPQRGIANHQLSKNIYNCNPHPPKSSSQLVRRKPYLFEGREKLDAHVPQLVPPHMLEQEGILL